MLTYRSQKADAMQLYKPLWEYIPVSQYRNPAPPASETVRRELVSLWERIHPVSRLNAFRNRDLQTIPPYLLNRAAPLPHSHQVVSALESSLQEWRHARDINQTVQVVVGAPGSGVEQVVVELAKEKGWQVIGHPSPEQILSGGDVWLEKVKEDNLKPLVIPRLGRCYLRHQEGLILISKLLDWLQQTNRRCLIACDSWAWAYLVKSLQIDVMLPTPLTLAPFDGARLQFWLPQLARRIHKGRFMFRSAETGQPVFPMADRYERDMSHIPDQEELYGDWVRVSTFFRQLAAYAHGLPGVVWAVWRQCLQVGGEIAANRNGNGEEMMDKRITVWVRPWTQLHLPFVPTPVGTDECFVLHSLLIHGGMTAQLLADLLPLSYNEVRRILHFFMDARLLEKEEETWRVSLLAYPAVRKFLSQEGYLVDEF